MKRMPRLGLTVFVLIRFGMGLFAGGTAESGAAPGSSGQPPAWVVRQPADAGGMSYFVAVGTDPAGNEGAARDSAALDLIGQINRYLGVSISSESTGVETASASDYQASVTSVVRQDGSGEVAGLRIADHWQRRGTQGLTIYLLGEYRTVDLEREKARRAALVAELEAAVAVPEGQARQAEAAGDPWGAANFCLQAARAALENRVRNAPAKLDRNLQDARRLIKRLELVRISAPSEVLAKQSFDQDFVVAVRDGETGRPLAGVELLVSYREYQSGGRVSQARHLARTDSRGEARIRPAQAGPVGDEQLSFSLNLGDQLLLLAAADGSRRDLVAALADQAGLKKQVFDYAVRSAGRGVALAIWVAEQDEAGQPTAGTSVLQGIQQRLVAAGYRLIEVPRDALVTGPRTEAEVRQALEKAAGSQAARLGWGIAAVRGLDDRGSDGVFAKVSATVSVSDPAAQALLASVTRLVNGHGQTSALATKDAFFRIGQEIGDQLARDLP